MLQAEQLSRRLCKFTGGMAVAVADVMRSMM